MRRLGAVLVQAATLFHTMRPLVAVVGQSATPYHSMRRLGAVVALLTTCSPRMRRSGAAVVSFPTSFYPRWQSGAEVVHNAALVHGTRAAMCPTSRSSVGRSTRASRMIIILHFPLVLAHVGVPHPAPPDLHQGFLGAAGELFRCGPHAWAARRRRMQLACRVCPSWALF